MSKRKTIDEFIAEANLVHHNKYDYSQTNYINCKTKVKIICPIHGIFEQIPSHHLRGRGCPKCGVEKRTKEIASNLEEFIQKANLIHNNKYDYSMVSYLNMNTKVKIICPIHGVFEQTPSAHILGKHGCQKCSTKKTHEKQKKTTEQFIKEVKQIYGDEYDYSLINYVNAKTKVKIICKKHGVFEILPSHFLSGYSCPKCGIESSAKKKILTTEEFIQKANLIHNNLYNYSLTKYIDARTKVKIICKKHGIFEQRPCVHLRGCGCPKCNSSKGELKIRNYLNSHNIIFEEQKRFPDCKYKNTLPFDFYLPNYNICIEYDGLQHFEPVRFFPKLDAEEKLKIQKIKDQIKTDYCKNNNIKLIRITYKDDIEEKLNEI